MKNLLLTLVLFAFAFSPAGTAQDQTDFELSYEVKRVYPASSISKEKLKEAATLEDLYRFYRPAWVKEYKSVELTVLNNGKPQSVFTKNDSLTQQQKELINTADYASDISVKVNYIPDNNLKDNKERVFDFTFKVDVEKAAAYTGGTDKLQLYLKENIIDKVPVEQFKQHQLSALLFTIDKEGNIVDPKIFQSTSNETTDALLLDTVRKMPCWQPGTFPDGKKVKQEFVLLIGDKNSCVTNLVNTELDWTPPDSK